MDNYNFKKRNINKFYSETEIINSPYFKGDSVVKIVVVSDMHYHQNVDKELFKLLISHCKETKPDFIVMPGDIVDTINFIDDPVEKEFFERLIREIAEIAPVIIVPGNHEIGIFNVDSFSNKKYLENVKALHYFDSLNRIKNVYFLNNEQVSIKGITFLGFNPRLDTYLKKDDQRTNDMFIEDYLNSGLKMTELDYNVLLTHSPIMLSNLEVVNSIYDFNSLTDLAISGHLHDGYLPKCLDKLLGNTNFGLFFTPSASPIPGIVCRGIHDFGRGYLFISQGFRKWNADIRLFNLLEKITANDVEELIIENSEIMVNNKKKIKRR